MEKREYNIVFVVDYTWGGHIPTYHKYICKALLELGYKVYSISPAPDDVKEWLDKEGLNKSQIQYDSWDKVLSSVGGNVNAGAKTANVAKGSVTIKQRLIKWLLKAPYLNSIFEVHETWKKAQSRIDEILPGCSERKDVFVLFPYAQGKLLAPGYGGVLFQRAFKLPWSGIFFHPIFFRTKLGDKGVLKIFIAPTCRSVALLDAGVMDKFQQAVNKKTVQFPDITNDELDPQNLSELAREVKERAAGRKVVSLLGVINNKKGVFTLIQAIKHSNERKLPLLFLIAGETNKYYWTTEHDFELVLKAIEKYEDNTLGYLHSLKDGHEYNSLVAVSDIIMASYQNFYHSSNTLTKAALFNKPVIVSKGYLMEELAVKYQLGIAIEENNAEMLISAIEHLAKGVDINGREMNPRYSDYYKLHTYQRLKAALGEMIV